MRMPPAIGAFVLAPVLTVAPTPGGMPAVAAEPAPTPSTPATWKPGGIRCVTRAEYGAVRAGMTLRRVGRIFGTPGYSFIGGRYVRTYPACRRGDSVTISYAAESKRHGLVVRGKRWNIR